MKLGAELSPREKNVLALICQDKANKTIAHDLGIAEATVKVMVRQIMKKSGVTNRTQLAYRVLTARAEAAEEERDKLREALGWYADIDEPIGNLARAALEAKP